MFFGSDMLYVQSCQWRIFLMKLAVFTAMTRPLPNQRTNRFRHGTISSLMRRASRLNTATNLFART